jgi:stringent starvation protein B
MRSSTPYLLRALNEWILDCDCTPHVIADVSRASVTVPPNAIQDGKVVLNIDPNAVRDLVIDDEGVSFVARFAGKSQSVWLPVASIEGIVAKETGQGMMFDPAPPEDESAAQQSEERQDAADEPKRPGLRVVK